MKYVSHVRGTLKQGCDISLGPKTIIVGPNGSGKSTILQTIELAAEGWVSDMEGRALVKQHTALARLFPAGVERFAEAQLSDGSTFHWSLKDGDKPGSFRRPEHKAPGIVQWPVQALTATLKSDSTTVAAWLEKQVVGGISHDALLEVLPPAVRDLTARFVRVDREGQTFDLLAVARTIKQEARRLRTQATKTETTLNRMTEGVAPPSTDEKRALWEQQLQEVSGAASGVSKQDYETAQQAVETARTQVSLTKQKLAQYNPLPPTARSALDRLKAAQDLVAGHRKMFGDAECWVCGTEDAGIAVQAERLGTAAAELQPLYQEGIEHRVLSRKLAKMERQHAALKKTFDELQLAEADAEERQREYGRLRAVIAADEAARRTWQNASALLHEVQQLRTEADLLSVAAKTLEKAGKEHLRHKKAEFAARISAFLPEGTTLGLDLGSARVGFVREGALHSALSGGEWSYMLLALAAAQAQEDALALLVPEDRGWDTKTLTSVMTALADVPAQVVILSTVMPEPVEGWQCVDLDGQQ